MTSGGAPAPRFSVVVPAFNAASTLAETLDAILAQTFTDWECIVVDDGSTDQTPHLAETYADKDLRIRVIRQANQGTAGAYNTGVSTANGELVVICSADDVLLPEHLSTMSSFVAQEPGHDIYTSNGYFWWPGDSPEVFYPSGEGDWADSPTLADTICSLELADVIRLCFYSVGATYRRGLYAAVGGYRHGVYGEDYDFWLRAMASGARHRYLPRPLSLHRVSRTQKSASLEVVYRSDIRLLTDLQHDFELSEADQRAIAESIQQRERKIALLHRPWRLDRDLLVPGAKAIAIRIMGRRRSRRIYRLVKSALGISRSGRP